MLVSSSAEGREDRTSSTISPARIASTLISESAMPWLSSLVPCR